MTDAVEVALIVAAPPTAAALVGLIVGLRNSTKTDKISLAVDGNLSDVKTELRAAREQISGLMELLSAKKKAK